jgi:hypothetical protein
MPFSLKKLCGILSIMSGCKVFFSPRNPILGGNKMEHKDFLYRFIKRCRNLLFVFGVALLMIPGCGTTPPEPPTANAGLDQNASAKSVVILDGSESISSTDETLTYAWTQTGGTAVALAGANTVTPIFTAPDQAGTLTFQLIVIDGNGTSTPDTVSITITVPTSESPIANAGLDQNVSAKSAVVLNGSGSVSQTGDTLSYAWMQIEGTGVTLTGANTATPNFTAPDQAGILVFQLVVGDVNGLSSPAIVVITVIVPTSESPTANAGPDQIVSANSIVALNGSESTSQTGDPLSFVWVQIGGRTVTLRGGNTATPVFTAPDQADTLTFQLIVVDVNGLSNPDTVTITVLVPTAGSPTANAGPNQTASAGATVVLNGSGSSSQTGDPLTFSWTQTGGTAVILAGANTATPIFTAPDEADTLTFQLVVRDKNGTSTPDTVSITVTAPPSNAPIANAGLDQTVSDGATVTLNGSGSTSLTGDTLSYSWTQTGGTAVTITGADTANPTFTAPSEADTLTFQLVVTDENGMSTPDTVAITVTETP